MNHEPRTTPRSLETGSSGEKLAAGYLESKGYMILERNYRFEKAEVDLICFQPAKTYEAGGEIVFVEVKTRTGKRFGPPEAAVTRQKQGHIVRAAEAYLYEQKMEGSPCRFDVISVFLQGGRQHLEHFEDAFWAS